MTEAPADFGATIATIAFSKDRPLQLDAALRSLEAKCPDLHRSRMHVLCATSHPRYAAGYRVLASDHPSVALTMETDFKRDLLSLVDGADYIVFLVDDTLVVGEMSLGSAIAALEDNPSCLGFSFRLGTNITYCYTNDTSQQQPSFEPIGSETLAFDWTTAEYDFAYPIEVASSMYRTADLIPLLRRLDYRNPNTLEGMLANEAVGFREKRPRMACYVRSVAFSVPANLVQTVSPNRVGGREDLRAPALLDRFARGDRLDLISFAGMTPISCHQEIDFAYVRDRDYPTVSVVIPCYGQARYLTDAVESLVAQSFRDWECIIVNDGSPDDTLLVAQELVRKHPDRRIRLITQSNAGVSSARNTGVRAARGRYILPLDADDMIGESMLQACVDLLEERPDIAIAFGDQQQRFGEEAGLYRLSDFDPFMMPYVNTLSYCSMYRVEVWDAVGGYNPNMGIGYEDWDFWIGAVEQGYAAARAEDAVTWYRIRAGSRDQVALEQDAELKRQIRANHPRLYRPWLRAARAAVGAYEHQPLVLRVRGLLRLRTRIRSGRNLANRILGGRR